VRNILKEIQIEPIFDKYQVVFMDNTEADKVYFILKGEVFVMVQDEQTALKIPKNVQIPSLEDFKSG
jgi:hypothetical protein